MLFIKFVNTLYTKTVNYRKKGSKKVIRVKLF